MPLNERCGVVLKDGTVIEYENTHPEPENNFAMSTEVLTPEVIATWHTHTSGSSNLSIADYFSFLEHPELQHFILSKAGVWCFTTINGILVKYENFTLPRFPEDLMPRTNPG